MANAIATIILVAVLLAGMLFVADGSLKSVNGLSDAWVQMETRSGDKARSELQVENTSCTGSDVEIMLNNSGQVSLCLFESWDLIVQYYSDSNAYYQDRLTYSSSHPPADDEWAVQGIYTDSTGLEAEVIQPGILDPEEYLKITVKLSDSARLDDHNRIIIAVADGVLTSGNF